MNARAHELRYQIRTGALAACHHDGYCKCLNRQLWESAITEIYALERAGETPAITSGRNFKCDHALEQLSTKLRVDKQFEQRRQQSRAARAMNDQANGADKNPASPNPLGVAIAQHAQALLNASKQANGMLAINPAQLYCDLELSAVRIEVLFEALVERGIIDPKALTQKLCAKLLAEVAQMNAAAAQPQIEIAHGHVPRNG